MDTLYSFELNEESTIINIQVRVSTRFGGDTLWFALDTGASHSVIDFSALELLGIERKDRLYSVEVLTGKGVVNANVYEVETISVFGQTKTKFEITAYDFLAEGVYDTISGMIGVDFLRDYILLLDFPAGQVGFLGKNPVLQA